MTSQKRPIRAVTHAVYGSWFIAVFSLCSITTLALVAFMPGQHRRRALNRRAARLVLRLTGSWPVVEGLENLPAESAVVVANHASYLDGVLLTAVLPHEFRFVIKREITRLPLVHFFLRRLGALFVERFNPHGSARDARKLLQLAQAGDSLAFFPEGTFKHEPGLRRFHNGAFTIAVRNSLAVVPVTIRGTREMLPADNILPRPARLHVRVNPHHPTRHGHTEVQQIQQECRAIILQQVNEPDHLHRGPR